MNTKPSSSSAESIDQSPASSSSQPSSTSAADENKNPWSSGWRSWLVFGAIAAAFYFGNVELQSYLGKQALAELAFPEITLEQAITQAKASNKLVLADMSAIWCPSCRRLDKDILSKQDVSEAINERYVFVRIEYESEAGKAFQKRYQVTGFPTLLVLDTEGNKLRNLGLTFDKTEFIRRLNAPLPSAG